VPATHELYGATVPDIIAAHRGRGRAASARPGGETCYRAALALAEPRGLRPLIARCHLGLGRLHRRLGRSGQADRFLETAMAMHQGMEMPLEGSRLGPIG